MKNAVRLVVLLSLASGFARAPDAANTGGQRPRDGATSLRFEVSVAPGLIDTPQSGRLLVALSTEGQPEPRFRVGRTGADASPVLATDVENFRSGLSVVIDESAATFPITSLAQLPVGEYYVQAVFDSNIDLKLVNAPGNLYSEVRRLAIDPTRSRTVPIELTGSVPREVLPPDREYVRFVKIQSDLLTEFHGRPIYLRAGVVLPRDHARDSSRRYPLRVHVGGYGARFTRVRQLMAEGSEFRKAWLADDAPRMILLHLDGAGPYGDPYQVNSANNGPYGDAITRELVPYVERTFRAVGEPYARVVDGSSTGGWVALALQVFYPDLFTGAWSYCPDSVDFRAYQLVNIYEDENAYVNERGFERPSARDIDGDVRFSMRHECQMENVLGAADSWTMSGRQWGAWNAVYGPRGPDGRPRPLWHPQTGVIDREVLDHWERYDLRLVLERNWKSLGPKLHGKIHIWVGEADNFFLNNAVHLLEAALSAVDPPHGGRIVYEAGKGHCQVGLTPRELMREMAAAIERATPSRPLKKSGLNAN